MANRLEALPFPDREKLIKCVECKGTGKRTFTNFNGGRELLDTCGNCSGKGHLSRNEADSQGKRIKTSHRNGKIASEIARLITQKKVN